MTIIPLFFLVYIPSNWAKMVHFKCELNACQLETLRIVRSYFILWSEYYKIFLWPLLPRFVNLFLTFRIHHAPCSNRKDQLYKVCNFFSLSPIIKHHPFCKHEWLFQLNSYTIKYTQLGKCNCRGKTDEKGMWLLIKYKYQNLRRLRFFFAAMMKAGDHK